VKQIKGPGNVAKCVIAVCLVLVAGCASPPPRPQASIVIERPPNYGDINIYPCTVKISCGQTAVLVGGENGVFVVAPGTYDLTAASSNPYPTTTKDSDWAPHPVEITLTNSQVMRIVVGPKNNGRTYVGGWEFKQQP
jgi:hypothetical protein